MIKTLEDFIREYTKIVNKGKIKTHRKGNTGIGKTLEDLLEISENNAQEPDFGEYELKSHRINTTSMLTLATKSPDSKNANSILLANYGYDNGRGGKQLHITLRTGFKSFTKDKKHLLSLVFKDNCLFIEGDGILSKAYWTIDAIKSSIERKYQASKLVYAFAESEMQNDVEFFKFVSAISVEGISGSKIIDLINKGQIAVDLRIGTYPNGRPHDHGTAFRILPKDEAFLFENVTELVGEYFQEINKK